jgi:hypothetical protein
MAYTTMKTLIAFTQILLCVTGLTSCQVDLGGNVDITHDTKSEGWITGKVVVPSVIENKLVWNGISGADVAIDGTQLSTLTSVSGEFSFDEVPTGTYNLSISKYEYSPTKASATVRRLQEANLGEIKLTPNILNLKNSIVYGVLYNSDKSTTANRVKCELFWWTDFGQIGGMIASTTTTSNGEFGFFFNGHGTWTVVLRSGGKMINFFESDLQTVNCVRTGVGKIIKRDAYLVD